jgi:nitroreductase
MTVMAEEKKVSATQKEELSELRTYEEGMPWNPVEKIIMERRSIRKFKEEPLPDSMIRRILEAGRFAPSTGNMQSWKFVVVNSREIIDEMEKDAHKVISFFMKVADYTQAGPLKRFFLQPMVKLSIWFLHNEFHPVPTTLKSLIAQGKTTAFHHAPTLILICEDSRGPVHPEIDSGVCGQNMALAAHSLGAGVCWLTVWNVIIKYMFKWKKKFGIKYPYKVKACLAVGWPDPKTDGLVPREEQYVKWFEGGMNDEPRIEKQGA